MKLREMVRWFLILSLVVGCVGQLSFFGGIISPLSAQEDESGETAVNADPDNTPGAETDVAKGKSAVASGEAPEGEERPVDEKDEPEPEEAKSYACSKCGYISDEAGDCPACNMSLAEVKSEEPGEEPAKRRRSSSGDGDNSASVDDDGNVSATSGDSSAQVGVDGSVSATDGQGNTINIDTGGSVNVGTGDY